MLSEKQPRTILVKIEMELVEGKHFNLSLKKHTDEEARILAEFSFHDLIQGPVNFDYIQSRIVEPIGDN